MLWIYNFTYEQKLSMGSIPKVELLGQRIYAVERQREREERVADGNRLKMSGLPRKNKISKSTRYRKSRTEMKKQVHGPM